ncbi:hypothetical protein ES702_05526 [subsurface metagenome]
MTIKECHGCGLIISGDGIEGVYYDGNHHAVCYDCFKKRKKSSFSYPSLE